MKINQEMSPILREMQTYLAPALFNSKIKELKRHVPSMQTSNQFLSLTTSILLLIN